VLRAANIRCQTDKAKKIEEKANVFAAAAISLKRMRRGKECRPQSPTVTDAEPVGSVIRLNVMSVA
jgi:hypothetical protein